VVLDARGEPVSLARVDVRKGQWNLASFVEVESSATTGQSHTLQLYYARAGKPVILAAKSIILR